jgi:hypothetical protein
VHYTDIANKPHSTFNRVLEFCELDKSGRVESYLDRINISDMDYKWKDRFNDKEKEILTNITGESKFKHLLNGED